MNQRALKGLQCWQPGQPKVRKNKLLFDYYIWYSISCSTYAGIRSVRIIKYLYVNYFYFFIIPLHTLTREINKLQKTSSLFSDFISFRLCTKTGLRVYTNTETRTVIRGATVYTNKACNPGGHDRIIAVNFQHFLPRRSAKYGALTGEKSGGVAWTRRYCNEDIFKKCNMSSHMMTQKTISGENT